MAHDLGFDRLNEYHMTVWWRQLQIWGAVKDKPRYRNWFTYVRTVNQSSGPAIRAMVETDPSRLAREAITQHLQSRGSTGPHIMRRIWPMTPPPDIEIMPWPAATHTLPTAYQILKERGYFS